MNVSMQTLSASQQHYKIIIEIKILDSKSRCEYVHMYSFKYHRASRCISITQHLTIKLNFCSKCLATIIDHMLQTVRHSLFRENKVKYFWHFKITQFVVYLVIKLLMLKKVAAFTSWSCMHNEGRHTRPNAPTRLPKRKRNHNLKSCV